MPFSPQPRKKGVPTGPRDGADKPSCGHVDFQKRCPQCAATKALRKIADAAPAEAPPSSAATAKILDLPTEKLRIARLRDKIVDKAVTDKRFSEKAAFVLSSWTSRASKKK